MAKYLFQLPEGHNSTLQAQIQEMMVKAILNKQLPIGSALPSGRKLAGQLKVSRNTVVLAYLHLMDEGFIESRERSGFYVRKDVLDGYAANTVCKVEDAAESPINWDDKLNIKLNEMAYLRRPNNWQEYAYPFIYGQYDKKIFPVADWRECCKEATSLSAIYDWARDHIDQDREELVKQIHEKVLPRRGIFVERDEILITIGAQNAIYLVANLLLSPDKTVAVEDPGYPDARNTFLTKTRKIKLIDVDDNGLVVDDNLIGCDCVYTTPSHQYPTTVTMPKSRRLELLTMAQEQDFLIIEDDYESELNYLGAPTPALKSLDKNGRVLYLGGLSKTLAPGIRVGFIVGSKQFIQKARILRRLMLRHPPSNNQYIIGLFLKRGYHDALIRKMSKTLQRRSKLMGELLQQYFPNAFPHLSFGGSSYWIEGPKDLDSEELATRAKKKGLLIESGNIFFHNDSHVKNYFRLGFSSISSRKIKEAIPLLSQLVYQDN